MSNALFLHDNQVERAVIAASSEANAMPATNLQDPQRTVMWRSAVSGAQTLDITLAQGEDITQAFAIVDHNVTLPGSIQLQAWDDALGGAQEVVNVTLQTYQPTFGYGAQDYGAGLYGGYDLFINGLSIATARDILRPILVHQIQPAVTARYWRITFNDAGLTYYQAGIVYLGPTWSSQDNFSFGSRRSRESRTRRRESRGGQRYGNPRSPRVILEFSMDWLSDGDRDRLWITQMIHGIAKPLILVQRPVGGYEQESTTFYGVFDNPSFEQVRQNQASSLIRFIEEL